MSSRRSVHFNRHLEIVDRVINSLLKEKLIQFGFIVSAATERAYRVFSLTWPASMQIYWNKKKRLHKKRVQLPKDPFGTPTWPPFHCFGTPKWPP